MPRNPLLADAATRAARYLETLNARSVSPRPEALANLSTLRTPLPDDPADPADILAQLDEVGSPATVASAGPRYFGFVTGGTLPAALAATWLAAAWDQNAALRVMSPIAAALEEVTLAWLRDIFGLPSITGAGFVTGATMANFSCLAAARHAILAAVGWNVEEDGLFGAPPITVVVGEEVHASMLMALSFVGFGRSRTVKVPTDDQGRMIPDALPPLDSRTILCIQAGNVNTGAFDPAEPLCAKARAAGAWVHVDGAFGLWAAAAPARAHLTNGYNQADSWAVDCHKWLNVPHDSGLAFVRHPEHLRAAMAVGAAYLQTTPEREPYQYTPEASRRARGIEIWAALRSLGRRGLAEMVESHCQLAARFADHLRNAGYEILNDVVLNQVLVSFGDIARIQQEGVFWAGGTVWHGKPAMRISISNWSTTEADIDHAAASIADAPALRAGFQPTLPPRNPLV